MSGWLSSAPSRRRWCAVLSVLSLSFVMVGCDGSSDDPKKASDGDEMPPGGESGEQACPAGQWAPEGSPCQPAGLPANMACPPGELLLEGGGCQAAGVPKEECGEGFVADDKGSCSAVLPSGAWSKGLMAIPGETAFREVAPCGSGEYGDIPVDPATTQFVNKAYPGLDSNGSQAKPWKTIQAGINAAAPGAIVAVAAGSYPEDVAIDQKRVLLWGRCPSMVEVVGLGVQYGAIDVYNKAADKAEIHSLAIRGGYFGMDISGASSVTIDRVWIHDTAHRGLSADDYNGPTSVLVKGALIEGANGVGVMVQGVEATLEGVVVRDTQQDAGIGGWGILTEVSTQTLARARVTVRGSVVEKNHRGGVFILGTDATLERVVVKDTQPDAEGQSGAGIRIDSDPDANERAQVTVRASIVEQNHRTGVTITGSDATLTGVVVRDTLPGGMSEFGIGISINGDPDAKERAKVTVRASVVEQSRSTGVSVTGSDATLEGVVVRNTLASGPLAAAIGLSIADDFDSQERARVTVRGSVIEQSQGLGVGVMGSEATLEGVVVRDTLPAGEGRFGDGVAILVNPDTKARAQVVMRASIVEQSAETGVGLQGSDLTLTGVVVRNTVPNAQGQNGRGIAVQREEGTQERANATIRGLLVEGNHEAGIIVIDSDATIAGARIHDTSPQGDGSFGDGIDIVASDGQATVNLKESELLSNARAGVANFGATVALTESVLDCNAWPIEGEQLNGHAFSFSSIKGLRCGCGEESESCGARSVNAQPPLPILLPSPVPPS